VVLGEPSALFQKHLARVRVGEPLVAPVPAPVEDVGQPLPTAVRRRGVAEQHLDIVRVLARPRAHTPNSYAEQDLTRSRLWHGAIVPVRLVDQAAESDLR